MLDENLKRKKKKMRNVALKVWVEILKLLFFNTKITNSR